VPRLPEAFELETWDDPTFRVGTGPGQDLLHVATRGVVVLLAVLGIALAFAPDDVPGLTIPGSPDAMEAMERLEMDSMEPARPTQMEDRTGAMP
jgi:hypothetical protein